MKNDQLYKKYLLINNVFAPEYQGGAGIMVENKAKELKNKGYKVIVLSTNKHFTFRPKNINLSNLNGIKVYKFSPYNISVYLKLSQIPWFLRIFWHIFDNFNIHAYFQIFNFLQKEKPDIIHTHNLKGLGLLITKAILKYKKMNSSKKIEWRHTLHDLQLIYPSGQLRIDKPQKGLEYSFIQKIYQYINIKLFSGVDLVIAPSKFILDYHIKRGFFKYVKSAIIPPKIDILEKVNIQNLKWQKPVSLLYLGVLEEYKGIVWLINQIKRSNLKDIILYIAGDGSQRNWLLKNINNDKRFVYLGFVNRKHLYKIFSKVHFLIMPSLVLENFPTVIVEALSYNIPVLSFNYGGISELVKNGQNGYLFAWEGENNTFNKIIKKIASISNVQYENLLKNKNYYK